MLEAEQAIKTQLDGAERRITTVHKVIFFPYKFNSMTRAMFHALFIHPDLNMIATLSSCYGSAEYILIQISILVTV